MIFDTHTHIYLEEFSDDCDDVVSLAIDAGVKMMMLPNVDVQTIEPLKQTLKRYPDCTIAAMGLHPTSVGDNYKAQLKLVYSELKSGNYKAVGEVGIDLYWDTTYRIQQIEAFIEQLSWANELSLPVIIHNREALSDTIMALKEMSVDKFIMHSFGGTPHEVAKVREAGDAYFGINGVATFKNSHLEDTIREIGIERLLVETDAPYLAPVPYRGKRNQPAYIVNTVNKIASVLNMTTDEIAEATFKNAAHIFNI